MKAITMAELRAAKDEARAELGSIPGVTGFGIGDRCLRVYLSSETAREKVPTEFHGVRIEPVVTGPIVAR